MIAVQELRIGNIVMNGTETGLVTGMIDLADGAFVFLNGNNQPAPASSLHPMPLTNDLVESCWFEEASDGFWWEHITATIYLQKTNGRWDFSLTDPREVAYWKPMSSLHQLQNLYFALMGTELEMIF